MPKFDFLFECAARAFLDGYYRECVLGIATAIERFFEFYVRVVCRKKTLSVGAFDSTWKAAHNQSERQLGAFAFVHLLHTGRAPDLGEYDTGKWKKLRNDATHKGHMPSREEALEYGQWARTQLHCWMKDLHFACEAEYFQEASTASDAVARKHAPNHTTMFSYQTVLAAFRPEVWGKDSFETSLAALRNHLAMIAHVIARQP